MIRILIQRITKISHRETKNFIIKSTPTEITESEQSNYGPSKQKVQCVEEYATREVDVWETTTTDLLEQNIEDDSDVNMTAIIKAINQIN